MTYKTANTQTEPKRIQRKRSKGWRMPPNTVSVTRQGKGGDPMTDSERKTEEIREEAILTIELMRDGSMKMSLPTEMLSEIPELLEESAAKIRRELKARKP